MKKFVSTLLFLVFCWGAGAGTSGKLDLLIPVYVYPTQWAPYYGFDYWRRLIRLADESQQNFTTLLVVNPPTSGVFSTVDPYYYETVELIHASSVIPLAFVNTLQGNRPLEDVLRNIDAYASIYSIVNLYLSASPTADTPHVRTYFQRIYSYWKEVSPNAHYFFVNTNSRSSFNYQTLGPEVHSIEWNNAWTMWPPSSRPSNAYRQGVITVNVPRWQDGVTFLDDTRTYGYGFGWANFNASDFTVLQPTWYLDFMFCYARGEGERCYAFLPEEERPTTVPPVIVTEGPPTLAPVTSTPPEPSSSPRLSTLDISLLSGVLSLFCIFGIVGIALYLSYKRYERRKRLHSAGSPQISSASNSAGF